MATLASALVMAVLAEVQGYMPPEQVEGMLE